MTTVPTEVIIRVMLKSFLIVSASLFVLMVGAQIIFSRIEKKKNPRQKWIH